jgi:hypothetical protein
MSTVRTKGRGEGRVARREADAKLFSSFEKCLPRRGSVGFLDHHHMAEPFRPEALAEIKRFCACWRSGGHEFCDRRLERLRRSLLKRCEDYLEAVDELTEIGPDGLRTVPRVLLQEDPASFDAAAYRLNRSADRVVRGYRRLHRAARLRLALTAAD